MINPKDFDVSVKIIFLSDLIRVKDFSVSAFLYRYLTIKIGRDA